MNAFPRPFEARQRSALLLVFLLLAMLRENESISDRGTSSHRTIAFGEMAASPETTGTVARDAWNDPLPPMPLLPITSETTVLACRSMKASPSKDIFVCSYPKSGTTWTQNIVVRLLWELASPCCPLPDDWHLSHSAPFYEVDQYWRPQQDSNEPHERIPAQTPIKILSKTDGSDQPANDEYRVFNTHLRPDQLPENAKCIYVVRDPFDVMISFYHHLSNQAVEDGGYTGTFDEFCKEFLDGTILYGKWQDHLEAWLGGNPKGNFLLLHYEDMKDNLEQETRRIAEFLLSSSHDDGQPSSVSPSEMKSNANFLEELVSRVVPHCTFQAMKKERHRYTPLTVSWKINPETGKPYDEFVRKGNVGDGASFFTSDSSSELQNRWTTHDVLIARERWKKANVDQSIVDRYLLR